MYTVARWSLGYLLTSEEQGPPDPWAALPLAMKRHVAPRNRLLRIAARMHSTRQEWGGAATPDEPGIPLLRPEERDLAWPFTLRARAVERAAIAARGTRMLAGRCTPYTLR